MKLPPAGQDLASLYPEIAAEWDHEKNDLNPNVYFPYSNVYVHWICKHHHRWSARINNRTRLRTQCPYCSGIKPIIGKTDLASLFPEVAAQWAPENSGTPSDVTARSNRLIVWRCNKGHRWKTKVYHRTDGEECPYCRENNTVSKAYNLETMYPDIAARWHPTANDTRKPSEFTPHSHYKAWWLCEKGHSYSSQIYYQTRGVRCPICAGKKVIAGVNDLESLAPNLAAEWDLFQNGSILPRHVSLHTNQRYFWKCSACNYSWLASPNNRSRGTGCPSCKHCCVDSNVNSLAVINPTLALQWDMQRNTPLTAHDIAAYDNRSYYWLCPEGHSWRASPANRNKGTSCPFCQHKKSIVGENDFLTLHPKLATQWHPTKNGTRSPSSYLPQSHEIVWWQCDNKHEWKASIYSRVNGSNCPLCQKRKNNCRNKI